MRILSLDLGTKSLGICVSDPSNIIGIPVENFEFNRGDYQTAINKVVSVSEEYNITTILLGHPKRQDGTKSEMTLISEEFFQSLKEVLPNIEIKLFDERYSTKRGIELLEQKYRTKEEVNKNKDMAAAYVMLIDYLSTI